MVKGSEKINTRPNSVFAIRNVNDGKYYHHMNEYTVVYKLDDGKGYKQVVWKDKLVTFNAEQAKRVLKKLTTIKEPTKNDPQRVYPSVSEDDIEVITYTPEEN